MQGGALLEALKPRSASLLEKILTNSASGIERRNLALPEIGTAFTKGAEQLNESFEQEAPLLASHALVAALEKSGHLPREVDALFICTCTGYLCPGVTSHVAELLQDRKSVV